MNQRASIGKLTRDERCTLCRGVLVPPTLASRTFEPPAGADYVCLNCGRPYRWVGVPPKLTLLVVVERRADDEPEDE